MSRCKCCNNFLSKFDIPIKNPHTGEEEELCASCLNLSFNSEDYPEYVGGNHPVSGVSGIIKHKD